MSSILKNYGTSDKVLSPAEAGYLAGFLDGEGCLTIGRARRVGYRADWSYFAVMVLANTNLEALERIAALCGNGKIQLQDKRDRPEHKTLYRLMFGAGQIRRLLPQVQQYLLIKRQQAELILQFLDLKEAGQFRTDEYWRECERLRSEIRTLNVRGIKDTAPDDIKLRARRVREGGICAVDGCGGKHYGATLCYDHYYEQVIKPRREARKVEKDKQRTCTECGAAFVTRRIPAARVCSKKCRGREYYRLNAGRIKAQVKAAKQKRKAVTS
jgi:hypothetical protein